MAAYSFRAAGNDGRVVSGSIEASSRDAALAQLRSQNLTPIRLAEESSGARKAVGLSMNHGPGVSNQASRWRLRLAGERPGFSDIHTLTGELSIMLRAGLPLDRALRVLIGMTAKPAMLTIIEDLLRAVKGGKGLSQALVPHADLFGDFYINMVRSGEAGGQLSDVLGQLAEHLERVRALRESVVSALIYPAILVVVAVISVFLMLGFVVPQFETLFNDLGDALPLPTRMIVAAGHFVTDYGWALLLGGFFVGLIGRNWLRTSSGRAWRDRSLLRFPVLGEVMRKYEVTRFARSMGTLLRNGVPIVSAIRIASETMSNQFIRASMVEVAPVIKRGGRLADAMADAGLFTPLALNMVRLGEETGRLDEMLLEVARIHDGEVQSGVKRSLQMVEPLLILVLGGVIALIIVSILMGIMSVNDLAG